MAKRNFVDLSDKLENLPLSLDDFDSVDEMDRYLRWYFENTPLEDEVEQAVGQAVNKFHEKYKELIAQKNAASA